MEDKGDEALQELLLAMVRLKFQKVDNLVSDYI